MSDYKLEALSYVSGLCFRAKESPHSTTEDRFLLCVGALAVAIDVLREEDDSAISTLLQGIFNTVVVEAEGLGIWSNKKYIAVLDWANAGCPSRVNDILRQEILNTTQDGDLKTGLERPSAA